MKRKRNQQNQGVQQAGAADVDPSTVRAKDVDATGASPEIQKLIDEELQNGPADTDPLPAADEARQLEIDAAAQAEAVTEDLPPAETLEEALARAAETTPVPEVDTGTDTPFTASVDDVQAPAPTDEPQGYVPPGTPEAEVAAANAATDLDDADDLAALGNPSRTKKLVAIGAAAMVLMTAIGFLVMGVRPKDIDTALPAATENATNAVAPAQPTAAAEPSAVFDLSGCTLSDIKVEGNDMVVGDCAKRITVK